MSAKEILVQSGGKNSEESSSYVVGLLSRPLYKRPPGYANQILCPPNCFDGSKLNGFVNLYLLEMYSTYNRNRMLRSDSFFRMNYAPNLVCIVEDV